MHNAPPQLPDIAFLEAALQQAQRALEAGEVPVGAVVVQAGRVIATGHNSPITGCDPTAHAEMNALRAAAKALGNYRLDGCDVYVTLEPCAMCAAAMLHARVRRVVFALPEAKTGAAGSVLNLFAIAQLNHHCEAVNASQLGAAYDHITLTSGKILQNFFQSKRLQQQEAKKMNHPLRDDAVRTPEARFEGLPGYPWAARYVSDLPALNGLRMHYLDEGGAGMPAANLHQDANPDSNASAAQAAAPATGALKQTTYLCLHGNPAWSYLYRKMVPIFLQSGARVVAPDLIGFGKSDKPKKVLDHSFTWHRQILLEFVERLNLKNVVLVVQDWGGLLGLTLPMAASKRYKGLLVMNTALATGDVPLSAGFVAWRDMCSKNPDFDVAKLFARGNPHMSPDECAAYNAPFPDCGHRAALRAFPPMVPERPDADGAHTSRLARNFWKNDWHGKSFMAIGQQDPVLGEAVMRGLHKCIANCPEPLLLQKAGHFVQERGETVATQALERFAD